MCWGNCWGNKPIQSRGDTRVYCSTISPGLVIVHGKRRGLSTVRRHLTAARVTACYPLNFCSNRLCCGMSFISPLPPLPSSCSSRPAILSKWFKCKWESNLQIRKTNLIESLLSWGKQISTLAAHLMESFSEVYLLGQSKEVELVCWNVSGFKSWVVTISINQWQIGETGCQRVILEVEAEVESIRLKGEALELFNA